MNKTKFFKILNVVLAFGVLFSLTKNSTKVKAEEKNSVKEKKLNEKEQIKTKGKQTKEEQIEEEKNKEKQDKEEQIEEKQIKGYELKQIVKKGNVKFLVYQHKLSGALAVVHNIKNCNLSGIYFASLEKNSLTKTCGLRQMLENKLKENFSFLQYNYPFEKVIDVEGNDCVLNLKLNFKDREIVDFVLNELKNPNFLKEENLTKDVKKQIKLFINEKINNFKKFQNLKNFNLYRKLNERFVVGNFIEKNIQKEIDSLTIEDLKEEYNKKFSPQNAMVAINSLEDKNYKEILENLGEKYFNYFEKTEEQNNFKRKTEKETFRELEVEDLTFTDFYAEKTFKKNHKFMARLYYDISKLSEEEKYFLALNSFEFKIIMKDYFKSLGYSGLNYNEKECFNGIYDTTVFDNLIFVDFLGDDEKLFEKETLIKNFENLIKEFVKRSKNLKEDEIKKIRDLILNSEIAFSTNLDSIENFAFSTKYGIEYFIIESFNLTKNPFSPKFFKIEKDGELKNIADMENFEEKFKDFEKNFNFFLENEPTYIDVLTVNKKLANEKNKNEINFKIYESPLEFPNTLPNTQEDYYSKENTIERILGNLIIDKFLKANLIDKGLVFEIYEDCSLCLPQSKKEEVEKYIFGEFKEDIKNYKPTEEEFERYKDTLIKSINLDIKRYKKFIEEKEEFLKNEKRIKKVAEQNKSIADLTLERLKKQIENLEKYLKNKEKEKKLEDKNLEDIKNDIKKTEEKIKELESNKENLAFFEEQVKKNNEKGIENEMNFLKREEEFLRKVEEIKLEDVLELLKNLKFKEISSLKEENYNAKAKG